VITSLHNQKVAAAIKLKKRAVRERERRFLVEGAQAVGEALEHPQGLSTLFVTDLEHPLGERARGRGAEVIHVDHDVMSKLTSTVTPQGLVGIASFVDTELAQIAEAPRCVAVLHAVRDPGNAGTVLRSADASGADAVIFSSESVDLYNPKTVRASAGSLFHVPVVRETSTDTVLGELRARGCTVYAAAADGEADLFELDLSGPVAFLFGNEAWGLPADAAGLADARVRIPIQGGAESLNLAAAATVCLFEWSRQRRGGGPGALETVIASAAHDIRSPLTAMKGFGYALSTRWEQMTAEQRSMMLEGIVYDTDRLNTILKQLVDAARIAAGTIELFPERVEVGEIVGKVAASLARDPEHPPLAWEGGEVTAFVDPERLRLVIEAFIESLVWWTNDGPVVLTARTHDGRLVLETFRAGTEITPSAAEGLFRPRAAGTGAGSKIGLFVADGVAHAQGGTTAVEVDSGLRFRLDIPTGEADR
jgi:TrmH family RNA methyltransferase